ncbi:26S proteasome non-ATPase regulatory subunit 9 [Globomyces pollinis-pini]|nr:26S proteasome non-ATPase regulatory subunit 9 [Globomyces pollinis-pini]
MTNNAQLPQRVAEVQLLMTEKDKIESKIQDLESILRSANVGMKTPLIDEDGFPRSDIDVYTIRNTRAALVPLYNDLETKMNEIQKSLIEVHALGKTEHMDPIKIAPLVPFAKVDGVAPTSPANQAGLLRNDLILKFGEVDKSTVEPILKIQQTVLSHEYKPIRIRVVRDGITKVLVVTPSPWSGRGLLGCHIIPV